MNIQNILIIIGIIIVVILIVRAVLMNLREAKQKSLNIVELKNDTRIDSYVKEQASQAPNYLVNEYSLPHTNTSDLAQQQQLNFADLDASNNNNLAINAREKVGVNEIVANTENTKQEIDPNENDPVEEKNSKSEDFYSYERDKDIFAVDLTKYTNQNTNQTLYQSEPIYQNNITQIEAIEEEEKETIILYLIPQNNEYFFGQSVYQLLVNNGVNFGEHNIFHRHIDVLGTGDICFSVANMLKPGTFDYPNLFNSYVPGLTFFMLVPNTLNKAQANFKIMLYVAENLAKQLNGIILNENRQPFSAEGRKQILDKLRAKLMV